MFCRCAAVSVTLLALCACGPLSSREVQAPPPSIAASTASAAARAQRCAAWDARGERGALISMIVRGQPLPVPPAAAEGLKQRRRVGVAAGLCLHQADACLLVGLLGVEQREVARVAVLPLTLGEIERHFGGGVGGGRRLELLGVFGERCQRIGY